MLRSAASLIYNWILHRPRIRINGQITGLPQPARLGPLTDFGTYMERVERVMSPERCVQNTGILRACTIIVLPWLIV